MTHNISKREHFRYRQHRQQIRGYLIWGGLGLAAMAVIGAIVWQGVRPRMGEEMAPMANQNHIPLDSDPGVYSTNPPSSGPHYAEELQAGFYETNVHPFPAGYLVHNLEHGYVILWYNCDKINDDACRNLKDQIKSVLADVNNFKVIAYPWDAMDAAVTMTSWGRSLIMDEFDVVQARTFYKSNLNNAPESNAP